MSAIDPRIRTLTCWLVYDPERLVVVETAATRRACKPLWYPGCVIVKMTGSYRRPKKTKPMMTPEEYRQRLIDSGRLILVLAVLFGLSFLVPIINEVL